MKLLEFEYHKLAIQSWSYAHVWLSRRLEEEELMRIKQEESGDMFGQDNRLHHMYPVHPPVLPLPLPPPPQEESTSADEEVAQDLSMPQEESSPNTSES